MDDEIEDEIALLFFYNRNKSIKGFFTFLLWVNNIVKKETGKSLPLEKNTYSKNCYIWKRILDY